MTTSFRFRLVTVLLGFVTFLALRGFSGNPNPGSPGTGGQTSLKSKVPRSAN